MGITAARERYGAQQYLAYFQAFTSTNAPVEKVREAIDAVLDAAPFRGLILATRPDCLPAEMLDLLEELAQTHDLWVELGVQSAHDKTLQALNRRHTFADAKAAIRALTQRGVHVAPHIILGLPGEDVPDMRATVRQLASLPCEGIKIHNLHIIAGTQMAHLWQADDVDVLDEHRYAEILMDILRRIPPTWPVMRLMSDTPRQRLLAPHWWLNKEQFITYVTHRMRDEGWVQGDLLDRPDADTGADPHMDETRQFIPAPPPAPQTQALFDAAGIGKRLKRGDVIVLDIGFGTGEAALCLPDQVAGDNRVRVVALGIPPTNPADLRRRNAGREHIVDALLGNPRIDAEWGAFRLHWGDPRRQLFRVRGKAHVILLEPTSLVDHVQLFSTEFLRRAIRLLRSDGVVISPLTDAPLRNALRRLKLHVGACRGPDGRALGTIASRDPRYVPLPLSRKEQRILSASLSGVPYHDADLTWPRERILTYRARVLKRLRRRGWRKRLRWPQK